MKIRHKIFLIGFQFIGLAATSVLTSCGDKFMDEYPWMVGKQENQSDVDDDGLGKTDITVLEGELKGAIPSMLTYASKGHEYQYQRSNSVDNYSGYWTTSQNKFEFGGALPTLYTYPNDYLGGPMNNEVFLKAKNAIFYAEELGKPEWRAVALIIQAFTGHELVDFYGSITFTDWRNKKRDPPMIWERGEDVYNQIFEDLNEAIAILKVRQPSSEELYKIEDSKTTLAKGDWRRWVKFANSIKLRMAMNIVKYRPADAQRYAEEAVNDEIGVMTESDATDIGYYYADTGDGHALYTITNSWRDIRLGASLENILKRYENPLLGVWFNKNAFDIYSIIGIFSGVSKGSDYIGIRQGVKMITRGDESQGYGPFSGGSTFIEKMPKTYFKRVEAIFLRAEGALRGWNMGATASGGRSAKDFYEAGIRLAFQENGITDRSTIDNYLEITEDRVKEVDYKDPYRSENGIKGRVKVGVKWEESDSDELKLEKIITQKYIANFPMGAEAWTTFRRTGYPRLFPVKVNNMPGVDTELQIRRIPLVETENNQQEYQQSMIPALGGPNTGATRVFWDVPTERRGEIIEDGSKFPEVIPVNF